MFLKAITIALSCIRTVDTEHLPDLLRFLLMSADKGSVGRIIFQIREQLKFVSVGDCLVSRNKKLKGKYVADGSEASILEALRSCLRFRNVRDCKLDLFSILDPVIIKNDFILDEGSMRCHI